MSTERVIDFMATLKKALTPMTTSEAAQYVLAVRARAGTLPLGDFLTYAETDKVFEAAELLARANTPLRTVCDSAMHACQDLSMLGNGEMRIALMAIANGLRAALKETQ